MFCRRRLSCKNKVMRIMVGTNDDDDIAEMMGTTTTVMMAMFLGKIKEGEHHREGGERRGKEAVGPQQEQLQLGQASFRH